MIARCAGGTGRRLVIEQAYGMLVAHLSLVPVMRPELSTRRRRASPRSLLQLIHAIAEIGERDLNDLFDGVGRSTPTASPLALWSDRAR